MIDSSAIIVLEVTVRATVTWLVKKIDFIQDFKTEIYDINNVNVLFEVLILSRAKDLKAGLINLLTFDILM